MLLEDAASILIDIEKLDTFILPINTELLVYCSLGNKVLKSAVGSLQSNAIAFDSLLHFPLSHPQDKELNFVLREKVSLTELGRCDLNLSVFDTHKTSKSVRIKLKSDHDVGIGFLELKVKLSELDIDKPSSAKYFRSPQPTRIDLAKVPAYDSRIQSLWLTLYTVSDIPVAIPGKFILTVHLGNCSLSASDLEMQKSLYSDNHVITVDRSFLFPYEGFQFLRFDLSVYSTLHPPVLLASMEADFFDFILACGNVRITSFPLEAVCTDGSDGVRGTVHVRAQKSTQTVERARVSTAVQ
eukprot:Protomagalhaensia_wolfi_Nauph_80__5477@NODE_59_length_4115_cov_62_940628_g49_i0_p2_GENE_NODE_59_length_4115_cov_62_940628_g49_i0NODE_59_length_4115_cov_62_940628_g49_i0_p2_ORF_typecomplete_len298_score22_59C2/PF00168_30/0_38C2/PF00168_30/6_8e03_NODE_59_length_4115_cov_62_940628_g49_i015012394